MKSEKQEQRMGRMERIGVRRYRSWWVARYGEVKGIGITRTEAIASLLLTLRNEVEVVSIVVKPKQKGGETSELRVSV